jgi:hypothetical protein
MKLSNLAASVSLLMLVAGVAPHANAQTAPSSTSTNGNESPISSGNGAGFEQNGNVNGTDVRTSADATSTGNRTIVRTGNQTQGANTGTVSPTISPTNTNGANTNGANTGTVSPTINPAITGGAQTNTQGNQTMTFIQKAPLIPMQVPALGGGNGGTIVTGSTADNRLQYEITYTDGTSEKVFFPLAQKHLGGSLAILNFFGGGLQGGRSYIEQASWERYDQFVSRVTVKTERLAREAAIREAFSITVPGTDEFYARASAEMNRRVLFGEAKPTEAQIQARASELRKAANTLQGLLDAKRDSSNRYAAYQKEAPRHSGAKRTAIEKSALDELNFQKQLDAQIAALSAPVVK